jgi:replication-associated recombination protein RarA
MVEIKGQDKLINKIKSLDLDEFPRTLLLEGPLGSGKHSIVEIISEHLSLEVEDITKNITLDTISDISLRSFPYIYLIQTEDINERTENVLLKFLEEPLKNSYIILLCENKDNLIETVRNRCQVWTLAKYDKEFLEKFCEENSISNDGNMLSIVDTPGQILSYSKMVLGGVKELAVTIYDKIHKASLPNTLSIVNKIGFKSDSDKVNVKLFMKILIDTVSKNMSEDKVGSYEAYLITNKYANMMNVKNLDKAHLFECFLIDLRNEMIKVWTSGN